MDLFALLIPIALVVGFIASYWVIFTKAGEAGWKCLIPIYNLIVLLKIINKPVWWFILLLIPLVNIVIIIMININDMFLSNLITVFLTFSLLLINSQKFDFV